MADHTKFMQGPERDAYDAMKARWNRATEAWVAAGKPERGPECGEMLVSFKAMEETFDALHVAAFGVPFPRDAA
jgi:hypothetical protein